MSQLVRLRRHDTGTPWGFRMNGGAEYGQPIYVFKVTPSSIAYKCGMRSGDAILQIGATPTSHMRHDQAKMEIIRAGNEVDFIVHRNVVLPQPKVQPAPKRRQRAPARPADDDDDPSGWQNPQVQSRSFKILQAHMEEDAIMAYKSRGAVPVEGEAPPQQPAQQHAPRGEVIEEKSAWHAQNPQVQSRSFKILQAQMEAEGLPGN